MANKRSEYLKVERSREARLWFAQVVVPTAIGATYIMSNPQAKAWITEKANKVKGFVANIFQKKDEQ